MKTALHPWGAALAASLLVAGASGVHAQQTGSIILTPYAGLYAPTSDVVVLRAPTGPFAASLSGRQNAAFAAGGNASYWFTHRVGIEVGGAYAWSDLKARGALDDLAGGAIGGANRDAYIVLGSAKMMANVLPEESLYNLRFGVGPAVIHRGGNAYKNLGAGKFTGLTDAGFAASLCSRLGIARDLFLRLRAESYLYEAQLKYENPSDPTKNFAFPKRFQNDVLLSAGLQYTFR